MVAAYKVPLIEEIAAHILIQVPTVILANLVLGENVVPQFLQRESTADALAAALLPLLRDTPERRRQVEAFSRLDGIMDVGKAVPSARAASVVLDRVGSGGMPRETPSLPQPTA
jgi:lipid-A-disaccharide synthase